MSVADGYSLAEDISRGIDCAMREAIECEEKANLLIKVMGGEAFDYVARHHGYVKERTCHAVSHNVFCGSFGCEEAGELWTLSCGHEVMNDSDFPPCYCGECGSKVVNQDG